jgi:hypothetical protein
VYVTVYHEMKYIKALIASTAQKQRQFYFFNEKTRINRDILVLMKERRILVFLKTSRVFHYSGYVWIVFTIDQWTRRTCRPKGHRADPNYITYITNVYATFPKQQWFSTVEQGSVTQGTYEYYTGQHYLIITSLLYSTILFEYKTAWKKVLYQHPRRTTISYYSTMAWQPAWRYCTYSIILHKHH